MMREYRLERAARILEEIELVLNRSTAPTHGGQMFYFEEELTGTRAVSDWEICPSELPYDEGGYLPAEGWQPFVSGQEWGGYDRHFFFKTTVRIPEQMEGRPVRLIVSTGREGQWDAPNPQFIAYIDGALRQGLDVNHREVLLTECANAGEQFFVVLHAYSGTYETPSRFSARICVIDRELEALCYDLKVPLEAAQNMEEQDANRIVIEAALEKAVNELDLRDHNSEAFSASVRRARRLLKEALSAGGRGADCTVTAVGSTHIDVAWLWRVRQTREKTARSFASVLENMIQYSEYRFMHSQPQVYEFLKQDHPDLYGRVKERIAQGRWEVEGAMWVEADCNLTSGESLVRQILYGKRFFKEEFGMDNKVLWLPDVFGYSAALPQILQKSGVPYFMTTKISWNQFNKIPMDTFLWQGIDGTCVLTHFVTGQTAENVRKGRIMTTYNAHTDAGHIMGAWERYQDKRINNDVLLCYGYGDGGGGPTREMLEQARRLECGVPGVPKLKQGGVAEYFERLDERVRDNPGLQKWVGELYLEYHRGTYTSVAQVKKNNRLCEFMLQSAEGMAALAAMSGLAYPRRELARAWKLTLLNQFHDILPGSSIHQVYQDTLEEHRNVIDTCQSIERASMEAIAAGVGLEQDSVLVFNPLGFEAGGIIEVGGACALRGPEGDVLCGQKSGENTLFYVDGIPARGYLAYEMIDAPCAQGSLAATAEYMENEFFRLEFAADGSFTRIYDKKNEREVLKEGGRGNVLQAFEDKPMAHDAWDIDIYYEKKMWEVNERVRITPLECGALRAVVRVEKTFGKSSIAQDIVIYRDIPRVDFVSDIDWKERQVLLKAAFELDVQTQEASYEIQFGAVSRPTHKNTSWDQARFEVCAHKWMDLSEPGYGVSLLNDCKYGCDIHGNTMRLSLLKSALAPNLFADRERHAFTYSLYPHAGGWREAGTVRMGLMLNQNLRTLTRKAQAGAAAKRCAPVSLDAANVILDTLKLAEDGGEWIVRLYESEGKRTNCALSFEKTPVAVHLCDLMEEDILPVGLNGNRIDFVAKPYEIVTFKVAW